MPSQPKKSSTAPEVAPVQNSPSLQDLQDEHDEALGAVPQEKLVDLAEHLLRAKRIRKPLSSARVRADTLAEE